MNQLRIPNEIAATIFVLLAGLSAILVAWFFSPKPNKEEGKNLFFEKFSSSLSQGVAERAQLRAKLVEQNVTLESRRLAITEATAALSQSEDKSTQLSLEIKTLRCQLAEASEKSSQSKTERSDSEKGLAGLRQKLKDTEQICVEQKKALQSQIKSLRRELDPVDESPPPDLPYLINEPLQISAPTRPLFARLRGFDGPPEELNKLYGDLKKDGKQSDLHKLPFTVGSSDVSDAAKKALAERLKSASPGSRFLVVGYASTDKNTKDNFELSSRRTSNVAEAVTDVFQGPEESVHAVNFGQTARFSKSEMTPNRIV